MKIHKLKENTGFTGQDILIAIFITMLFLSFITTMIINLSNTNYEIEKTRQVTELLSKIADKIDQMGYDELETTVDEKDISDRYILELLVSVIIFLESSKSNFIFSL